MELSGPVVVQHHGLLTLTLDFERVVTQEWDARLTWNEKDASR